MYGGDRGKSPDIPGFFISSLQIFRVGGGAVIVLTSELDGCEQ